MPPTRRRVFSSRNGAGTKVPTTLPNVCEPGTESPEYGRKIGGPATLKVHAVRYTSETQLDPDPRNVAVSIAPEACHGRQHI